jgi:MFS transporter, MHS family, dicarboxylic acid transporter PcaT
VTQIGGQLLALLVLVVLQALLDVCQLKAWGWRIPFVIGAIAWPTPCAGDLRRFHPA